MSEISANDGETRKTQKKPFDKKKWREQRYSHKAKVERWDEARRKVAMRKYHRELKKAGLKGSSNDNTKPAAGSSRPVSALKHAELEFKRKQEEEQQKREEEERVRGERNAALKAYREKKAEKFRKLSKKTRKGQPVMKGRMELLLEKIQRDYAPINS